MGTNGKKDVKKGNKAAIVFQEKVAYDLVQPKKQVRKIVNVKGDKVKLDGIIPWINMNALYDPVPKPKNGLKGRALKLFEKNIEIEKDRLKSNKIYYDDPVDI